MNILNLFGIEWGNGSSSFVTSIAMPLDLKDRISQEFFKPLKQDNRGCGASVMIGSTANIDLTNNTHDELDNNNDKVNSNGEHEDSNNAMDTTTVLSPKMIASHVSLINECNSEPASDHEDNIIMTASRCPRP